MRILVFGDSITYGKVDSEGGWANRLRRHFDEQSTAHNHSRDFPNVYNQGISGDTAEDILKRFDVETSARAEDETIFIFAVGTNDSSLDDGQHRFSKEQFQKNFEDIIRKAQKYTDKILIVGLLPVDEKLTTPIPWRPKRHYTNEQILLFDGIIKTTATKSSLPYVPLFEDFKNKLDLFPDGLHPDSSGHKIMFDLIRPELEKLI